MKKIVSILGTLMLLLALSVPVSALRVQHDTGVAPAEPSVTEAVEFPFTVVLLDAEGNELAGEFEFIGTKSGTIRSGDTIMLGDADYIDILDLPAGTQYIVTEGATDGWYLDESIDTEGVIADQVTSHAQFVNKETEPARTGTLVISKTVIRDGYAEGVGDAIHGSDGIPDECQVVVDFTVVNGTPAWSQACLTLRDEDGNPSENGTAVLTEAFIPEIYPDASMKVETGFTPDVVLTSSALQEAVCGQTARSILVQYVDDEGVVLSSSTAQGMDGEPYILAEAPAVFDLNSNHYVLNDVLPKTVAATDDIVKVQYARDNVGGGSNGTDSDGVPDMNQVIIIFSASNGAWGTVSDECQVFNLGSAGASGSVHLSNIAETTELSRTYFRNWTNAGDIISSEAVLDVDFAVIGGSTYQIIANFSRTGVGPGGGGGGGGGSPFTATVTFEVVNGRFIDGSNRKTATISYNTDESPVLSQSDIPSASPNLGYAEESWSPRKPVAGMTVEDGAIFVLTYNPDVPPGPVGPVDPIVPNPGPDPTDPGIGIPDEGPPL